MGFTQEKRKRDGNEKKKKLESHACHMVIEAVATVIPGNLYPKWIEIRS